MHFVVPQCVALRMYTYIWPGHHELIILTVVTHHHTTQLTTKLFQSVLQHVTTS